MATPSLSKLVWFTFDTDALVSLLASVLPLCHSGGLFPSGCHPDLESTPPSRQCKCTKQLALRLRQHSSAQLRCSSAWASPLHRQSSTKPSSLNAIEWSWLWLEMTCSFSFNFRSRSHIFLRVPLHTEQNRWFVFDSYHLPFGDCHPSSRFTNLFNDYITKSLNSQKG